jgi:proteasome lid subunit RPN8/RPN11
MGAVLQSLLKLFAKKPRYRVIAKRPTQRVLFAETLPFALQRCIAREIADGHEGVAYLFGQTDGFTTIILGAIRPDAVTTQGSFNISSAAAALAVRKVNDLGLQLVGQAHSHPGQAYHSEGDEIGARIAYTGFVSIVVPNYGRQLPSLNGWAAYFFSDGRFIELRGDQIRGVPQVLS